MQSLKNNITSYQGKLKENKVYLELYIKRAKSIVAIRLLLAAAIICLAYFCFTSYSHILLVLILMGILGFVYLIQLHAKIRFKKDYYNGVVKLNEDELSFLKDGELPFADGECFTEENHFYSNDLDFFGPSSLYQYLNRTQLFIGSRTLSNYLKNLAKKNEILERQEAVKELAQELDWRQKFEATAAVGNEKEETYFSLLKWADKKLDKPSGLIRGLAFALPVILIGSIILSYFTTETIWGSLIQPLIIVNLLVAFSQIKYIRQEIVYSDQIKSSLKSYGILLELVEQKDFKSTRLIKLKQQLIDENIKVSSAINNLAKLYANLDNINNPFGAILFNAITIYHVHALYRLKVWKEKHAKDIKKWMEVLGEFEALNSLANYSFNNPSFVFPWINEEDGVHFKKLGHPLIKESSRIANSVSFKDNRFIILTGSNMSGKSTFLRSLGVNMVLGQVGAPVCAIEANITCMPVLVSMRVSDNLSEGESFFFAEVKRLKQIMEAARSQKSFVLLDEILRGTNSDDKRTGTIEVIKNIIKEETIGAIATHDLKVCDTTSEYPSILANKCFEVEIKNNELDFDYLLREGVCKNKSATFLMKKMEVI